VGGVGSRVGREVVGRFEVGTEEEVAVSEVCGGEEGEIGRRVGGLVVEKELARIGTDVGR
jgi:hypothetical protein